MIAGYDILPHFQLLARDLTLHVAGQGSFTVRGTVRERRPDERLGGTDIPRYEVTLSPVGVQASWLRAKNVEIEWDGRRRSIRESRRSMVGDELIFFRLGCSG